MSQSKDEVLIDELVSYTLERDGQFYIVEHVPARVNPETGEQFFAPETVERLQAMLLSKTKPIRTVETPVFEYAD